MGPLETRRCYFPHLGWYIMMPVMNLIGLPLNLTFTASFAGLLAAVGHSTNTDYYSPVLLFLGATVD